MTIQGLDLSAVQGDLTYAHWATLAGRGVRFVYLEGRRGNDGNDARFAAYAAGARAAGIAVGAYLFAYPLPTDAAHPGRDPESQVQAFYEACDGLGSSAGDLPPAIDLEWPPAADWPTWGCSVGQIGAWVARAADKAEALFGVAPLLYVDRSYAATLWQPQGLGAGSEARLRLWLAAWGESSPAPPWPWSGVTMQQISGGGYRLPNGAPCDEDLVSDEATFAALLVRP